MLYAKQQIAQFAQSATTFRAPGPAFTKSQAALLKSKLSGKTLWFIPVFQQAIQFSSEITAFTEAAKVAGAKVHVCDAQVNPSTGSQCLKQAVSSGAAGIVTSSLDYGFAQQAFQAVLKAKIPLVMADDDEVGANALPASSTARQLSIGGTYFGRLGADWVIADSHGTANVLYAADDASSGALQLAAATDEFKTRCPACKVTVIHFNDASLPKLTTAVSAALIANSKIRYVFNAYDEPSGAYAVQGLQRIKGRSLKFVGGGGSPVGLQRIQKGEESASPGVDTSRVAWDMADAVFRFVAGVPQINTYPKALRLFTKDNLPADVKDTAAFSVGSWYSNGNFRAGYKTLWPSSS